MTSLPVAGGEADASSLLCFSYGIVAPGRGNVNIFLRKFCIFHRGHGTLRAYTVRKRRCSAWLRTTRTRTRIRIRTKTAKMRTRSKTSRPRSATDPSCRKARVPAIAGALLFSFSPPPRAHPLPCSQRGRCLYRLVWSCTAPLAKNRHCEASAHTGCSNPHPPVPHLLLCFRRGRCPCRGAQNFCAAPRRTLVILNAATRSFCFFRHRRRWICAPHRPVSYALPHPTPVGATLAVARPGSHRTPCKNLSLRSQCAHWLLQSASSCTVPLVMLP